VRRLALSLLLTFSLSSCITEQQWHRFRSHSTATLFSTVFGALAVVVGGPIGLIVAGTGVLGGVVIDQTLEPEPEVRTRTVTTLVEWPPPLPDGTQPPASVKTYVDKNPSEAPAGGLRIPGMPNLPPPSYWERVWTALKVLGVLLVFVPVLIWLLRHPFVRAALWGAVCWVAGVVWHTGARGVEKLREARERRKNPPPEGP
jgi:hypothetical protein